ncbi:MAG TPA: hypothetical protein VN414_07225 [Methanosarcina sp.]|nr:hypothetical protein [Methanosarcina sp.]
MTENSLTTFGFENLIPKPYRRDQPAQRLTRNRCAQEFYKKSQVKPASIYAAFIVAFAVEIFGVPFSMFIIGRLFGI